MKTTCCAFALTRIPWTPPPCFNFKMSAWDTTAVISMTASRRLILIFISFYLLLLFNDGQAGEDLQIHHLLDLRLDLQPPGGVFHRQRLAYQREVPLAEFHPPALDVHHARGDLDRK